MSTRSDAVTAIANINIRHPELDAAEIKMMIDTEALLVEQARKELEHGISLDPGVPCILVYGSDSD